MLYDYDNPNKEQAVNFFHKAKRIYEIFGLKNSFALIETKKFGKTFYSMYDKESDEHKNFKIIEE